MQQRRRLVWTIIGFVGASVAVTLMLSSPRQAPQKHPEPSPKYPSVPPNNGATYTPHTTAISTEQLEHIMQKRAEYGKRHAQLSNDIRVYIREYIAPKNPDQSSDIHMLIAGMNMKNLKLIGTTQYDLCKTTCTTVYQIMELLEHVSLSNEDLVDILNGIYSILKKDHPDIDSNTDPNFTVTGTP